MRGKSWTLNTLPNGVTHLTMLLIDIKIPQNRAEKYMDFEHPTFWGKCGIFYVLQHKKHYCQVNVQITAVKC